MSKEMINNGLKRSNKVTKKSHRDGELSNVICLYNGEGDIILKTESNENGVHDTIYDYIYEQIGVMKLKTYSKETRSYRNMIEDVPQILEYWWKYDENGNMVSYITTDVWSSGGNTVKDIHYYLYDKNNNVINVSVIGIDIDNNYNLVRSTSNEYDNANNLIKTISCTNINIIRMNSVIIDLYEYDDRHNMIKSIRSYNDCNPNSDEYYRPTIICEYDDKNNKIYERRNTMTLDSYIFEYDKNNNIINTININRGYVESHTYDENNNKIYTKTYHRGESGSPDRIISEEWIEFLD